MFTNDDDDLSVSEITDLLETADADVNQTVVSNWTQNQRDLAVAWALSVRLDEFNLGLAQANTRPSFVPLKVR